MLAKHLEVTDFLFKWVKIIRYSLLWNLRQPFETQAAKAWLGNTFLKASIQKVPSPLLSLFLSVSNKDNPEAAKLH